MNKTLKLNTRGAAEGNTLTSKYQETNTTENVFKTGNRHRHVCINLDTYIAPFVEPITVLKHGPLRRNSYRCFRRFLLGKPPLLLCQMFAWPLLIRSRLIHSRLIRLQLINAYLSFLPFFLCLASSSMKTGRLEWLQNQNQSVYKLYKTQLW